MNLKMAVLAGVLALLVIFSSGCLSVPRDVKPELCEKISLQENKDTCYRAVASSTRSELYCAKIADINERDGCYTDIALGYARRYYFD